MPGENSLSRLSVLYGALAELSQYYKLKSFFEQGLDEAAVEARTVESQVTDQTAQISTEHSEFKAMDTSQFVSGWWDPSKNIRMDYLRDLLFSATVGCLRATDIVQLMEDFGHDGEKALLAIQPFLDGAADIATVPSDSWPLSCLYTGASSVTPPDGDGFTGMTRGKTKSVEAQENDAAEESNVYATKVYNISTLDESFSRKAADNAAMTIFLNAIPTHEWSRAVPYLDVQFMQDGGYGAPACRAPNIYRFLLGSQMYSHGGDLAKASRFAADVTSPSEGASTKWISGMEVFTSPQTMVNANERSGTHRRLGGLSGNENGVIDPFRPFMSLLSLTIDTYPRVNNIIFTQGTLVLKLHDKSRIAEISGLTSPQGFGKTFLMITYGWSHPDGDLGAAAGVAANPFGMFIDSMKSTEHFTVSTASYSFTKAGEVDITLKIYSRAAGDLTTDVGILDDVCSDQIKMMQQFEELSIAAADMLPDDPTAGYPSRSMKVLKPAGEPKGAYVLSYEQKDVAKYKKQIDKLKSTPDPDLTETAEAMDKLLLGLNDAKTTIKAEFDKKVELLKTGPDPWLAGVSPDLVRSDKALRSPVKFLEISTQKTVVSLAKAVSIFVAGPLAEKGTYSEIQLFYGCLNSKASYARNASIASFPLQLDGDRNLIKALYAVAKATGHNLSLGDFVGVLNNYFFENYLCPVFGFSRTRGVSVKPDKDTGYLEVKYASEKSEQRSVDAIAAVLADAYDGEDLPFVQPQLTFSMKTAPIARMPDASEEASLSDETTSILRVFFEDSNAEAYSGTEAIIQTAFDEYIPGKPFAETKKKPGEGETVNKIGERIALYNNALDLQDFSKSITTLKELGLLEEQSGRLVFPSTHQWKDILKSMAPYIDIGSSNTAVTNMNIQNQSGGNLQTINMIRGQMSDVPGLDPVSMPLQMMPAKASAEFIGCPLLLPMQSYFIDMRTGTDLDSTYGVFKVTHNIAPGKFTTSAELMYMAGYARFQAVASKMNKLANKLIQHTHGKEDEPRYPGMAESLTAGNYEESLVAMDDASIARRDEEGRAVLGKLADDVYDANRDWATIKKDGLAAYAHYQQLCTKRSAVARVTGDLETCYDTMSKMWMIMGDELRNYGQWCGNFLATIPARAVSGRAWTREYAELAAVEQPSSGAYKLTGKNGLGYKSNKLRVGDIAAAEAFHKLFYEDILKGQKTDIDWGDGILPLLMFDEKKAGLQNQKLNLLLATRPTQRIRDAASNIYDFQMYITTILNGGSREWYYRLPITIQNQISRLVTQPPISSGGVRTTAGSPFVIWSPLCTTQGIVLNIYGRHSPNNTRLFYGNFRYGIKFPNSVPSWWNDTDDVVAGTAHKSYGAIHPCPPEQAGGRPTPAGVDASLSMDGDAAYSPVAGGDDLERPQ